MQQLALRKTPHSRRTSLIAAGLLAATAPLARIPSPTTARRHDEHDSLAGVTITSLCSTALAEASGKTLALKRVSIDPGAALPPHTFPGPVVVVVESGVFGTEIITGRSLVTTAAIAGTPPTPIELLPGDNISMSTGDSVLYDRSVQTMRNDGDDVLVMLLSGLLDTSVPDFALVEVGRAGAVAFDD